MTKLGYISLVYIFYLKLVWHFLIQWVILIHSLLRMVVIELSVLMGKVVSS